MRAVRPDLGMCAEQLILEQAVAENRIIQANAGLPPRTVNKAQNLSQKLRKCYATYNVKPLKDYLRGIALNFQFNYKNVSHLGQDDIGDLLSDCSD